MLCAGCGKVLKLLDREIRIGGKTYHSRCAPDPKTEKNKETNQSDKSKSADKN